MPGELLDANDSDNVSLRPSCRRLYLLAAHNDNDDEEKEDSRPPNRRAVPGLPAAGGRSPQLSGGAAAMP
jgi:hypothetical protein